MESFSKSDFSTLPLPAKWFFLSVFIQQVCPATLPHGQEGDSLCRCNFFNWRMVMGRRLWGKGAVVKNRSWKSSSGRFSYWSGSWVAHRSTRSRTQVFSCKSEVFIQLPWGFMVQVLPILDLNVSCEGWLITGFLETNFTYQLSSSVSPERTCTLQVTSLLRMKSVS